MLRAAITCPVTVIRAAEGFAPGSPPLIDPLMHQQMRWALRPQRDIQLSGSTHLTVMTDPYHAAAVAVEISGLARSLGLGAPPGQALAG